MIIRNKNELNDFIQYFLATLILLAVLLLDLSININNIGFIIKMMYFLGWVYIFHLGVIGMNYIFSHQFIQEDNNDQI